MARTILTIGSAGFIGSNFLHYWSAKYPDDKFIVIDKFGYAGKWENLSPTIIKGNCESRHRVIQMELGVEDTESVFSSSGIDQKYYISESIKTHKPTLCVNFFSESHVCNSITGPQNFNTNYTGMLTLLEALKDKNIPLYHLSTDEILKHHEPHPDFGFEFCRIPEFIWADDYNGSPEIQPSSVYSASKAAQEMLVHAYRKTWDMNITIVRLTNNYGPRQHTEKLLPKVITNTLSDHPIPVYGSGEQWRDWLYVEDSCSALDLIINKGGRNETYHVSAQQEKQNLDVIKQILKKIGKPESLIQHVEDRKGHDFSYSLDSSKLRSMGWKPKVSLDEGLDKTIEWYKR